MPVTREREGGFRDAISEFKSISDLQTCYCHYNTALESSYDAIKEMHPDFTKRTGIFTASDHIAYGVMKYVLENRYKIGDQVGIIGYDNLETDAFTTVPLSSIEQKGRLMGESACKLLFEKIENKSEIGSLILKPELIRRKSCGC